MKIAVTYKDGKVDQHFGMATQVKFYDIQNGSVASTEIVELTAGHTFIARVIYGNAADAVICGHIKPGAANGLLLSGLMLCAGAEGDADAAVEAYLAGTLKHDPEAIDLDETCGHDD